MPISNCKMMQDSRLLSLSVVAGLLLCSWALYSFKESIQEMVHFTGEYNIVRFPAAELTEKESSPRSPTADWDNTSSSLGADSHSIRWSPPVVPDHLQSADQNNQELVKHIRDHWILPQFPVGQLHLQKNKEHYSQSGQSEAMDRILVGQTSGFFIECGAASGERLSNTLFFEKSRNWTGLLVEPNPDLFAEIVSKRRHAYMINACLSPYTHPAKLKYNKAALMGGLDGFMEDDQRKNVAELFQTGTEEIQCFPLMSILKAIGRTRVDYFSLDVEGPEMNILQSLSFDAIFIRTFTIEYRINGDKTATEEKLKAMNEFLVGKHGYTQVEFIKNIDVVFQKK